MNFTAPLRRFAAQLDWNDLLRPRMAWAAMALSALVAGVAIQHSIERLESAAQARAHFERQSNGLHERFQASSGAPVPALQQIRASHDEAVASAAAWSRWTVWGSLTWMLGVGLASAWTLQRRSRADARSVDARTPAPAATTPLSMHAERALPQAALQPAGPDWQALRAEIEALRDLVEAPASLAPDITASSATATATATATERIAPEWTAQPTPAAVVGRIEPTRPPFELREAASPQLRLAA